MHLDSRGLRPGLYHVAPSWLRDYCRFQYYTPLETHPETLPSNLEVSSNSVTIIKLIFDFAREGWLTANIGAWRLGPHGTNTLMPLLIEMLAIAVLGGLGFLLANGKLNRPIDGIASRYQKRSTLAVLAFGLVLASAVLEYFGSQVLTNAQNGGILRNPGWWGLYWQFVNSIYPMIVALVVVRLAPLRPANA